MISNEELSALVAEKVMDLHLLKEDRTRCVAALNKRGTAAGMQDQPVPAFATNAGLALEAAMRMAWDIGIQVPDSDPMCRAKLLLRRPGVPVVVYGDTVARALCLAALRACGEMADVVDGWFRMAGDRWQHSHPEAQTSFDCRDFGPKVPEGEG